MNRSIKYTAIIPLFLITLFAGCKEELKMEIIEAKAPVITDFSPKSGEVGTEITITGDNLQFTDNVIIGEGEASIKYKVNSKELIVVVTPESKTGIITVKNAIGDAESSENFTITYNPPVVDIYPTEGTVNDEIVIEGRNLQVVTAVVLGESETTIVSKRENELVFKIPYSESETPVALRLEYFDGENDAYTGPAGETFTILKEAPAITTVPASLEKYQPVTIRGERLAIIDKIMMDDIEALIISRTDEEITFDLPTDYFGGNKTVTLKVVYYGVREIVLSENFNIISNANEGRYYTHSNVLMTGRTNEGGTEDAFFDAESGNVINSCGAYPRRTAIDFIFYDQAGYVQLYGPHQARNILKNFKCEQDGKMVSITTIDTDWEELYATETKFKVLSKDSVNHLAVINAFEAGTIIELNDEFFAGISQPGTSSPRIYKSKDDSGFNVTSGHYSIDYYNLGWVKNYTTGKNGIIKFTAIPGELSPSGRYAHLTFDIIWGK